MIWSFRSGVSGRIPGVSGRIPGVSGLIPEVFGYFRKFRVQIPEVLVSPDSRK
jgi:hypothetical protein